VLDISLKQEVIEIISASLKANEINEIGIIIFKKFDLHQISNTRSIETLSSLKSDTIIL
jgi:hypothetical protein